MNHTASTKDRPTSSRFFIALLTFVLFILPSFNCSGVEREHSKSAFFLFTAMVLSILWAFQNLRFPSKKISIGKVDIWLTIWSLYTFGHIHFTQSPFTIRVFELGGLVLLYIYLRNITESQYGIVLLAIIAASAIQALYGNLQLWGVTPSNHAYFKMTGSFLNPGPYAGYLVSAFSIIAGLAIFHKSFIPKANIQIARNVLLFTGALILLAWSAADSRASYIALACSVGFILWKRYSCFNRFRVLSLKMRSSLIASILLLLIFGCIGLFKMKPNSAMGRVLVWNISSEIIAEKPLIGIGFDNFKSCYMHKQAEFFKKNPDVPESMVAGDTCYAFNEYLQTVVETGLVGLILSLGILASAFRSKSENLNEKENILVAKAGILSIAVFALFSYPAQILPIKINLVCFLAWIANMDKKVFYLDLSHMREIPILFSLLFAGIGIWGLCKSPSHYRAYKNWSLSRLSYERGNYAQCVTRCRLAYPLLKENGDFLTYYGKALTLSQEHDSAIKILNRAASYYPNTITYIVGDNYVALKCFNKAEQSYLQAWHMVPSKFYPLYKLAKLYDKAGQEEQTVSIAIY